MRNHDREEIDRILDSALASYSAESGSFGLEDRVLSRVRYAATRPLAAWWWQSPVLAAFLLCLILSGVFLKVAFKPIPHRPPGVPIAQTSQAPARVPVFVAAAEQTKTTRRVKRRLPKLNTFPSPKPLSDEERAVLELAKFPPEEVSKLVTNKASTDLQLIHIEPLKIEPL